MTLYPILDFNTLSSLTDTAVTWGVSGTSINWNTELVKPSSARRIETANPATSIQCKRFSICQFLGKHAGNAWKLSFFSALMHLL